MTIPTATWTATPITIRTAALTGNRKISGTAADVLPVRYLGG